MTDFDQLLKDDINKEIEKRKGREKSGKFSPSRMGRCLRFQYWQRMNEPETDPIPIEVYKKFRAGNIYHHDLQSLVENTEVKFENDNFICFADHVAQNEVVDFKTVFSSQYRIMKTLTKQELIKDKTQYIMQLMAYCYFLEKPIGTLVFVNKDDYDILQLSVELSEYKDIIEKEISDLLDIWEKKELPPPIPRCYIKKKTGIPQECAYCNYRTKCKEDKQNAV